MVPCSIMIKLKLSIHSTYTILYTAVTVDSDDIYLEMNKAYQSIEEPITQLNDAYGMCTHEDSVIEAENIYYI